METYNVLQNLGRGTFGTVYLCERKHNKQKLVVKEIYIDNDKEKFKACKTEVAFLKYLNHANVIQYYDSFSKNGSFYICMEYARSGTLFDYIKNYNKNLLEKIEVMDLFCQILLGLNHMHSKKVMHRDLKSENIFLTGYSNVVKIGDFGISKSLPGNTKTSTSIGTQFYTAPEVLDGKPYDMKADIWALGCLLFELCARERYFNGSVAAVCEAIKGGSRKIISLNQFGMEIQQVIDHCLCYDPDGRPSCADLMCYPQIFPYIQKTILNIGSIMTN